jgi:hypothetical protein
MPNRWGVSSRISDRVRIGVATRWGRAAGFRPPGVSSGRWIAMGPVWIRLGSRSSWRDEDVDAEMIKPVEP